MQLIAAVELGGYGPIRRANAEGEQLIGAITVFRQEVRPFTDKQIDLVSKFCRPGGDRGLGRAAAE